MCRFGRDRIPADRVSGRRRPRSIRSTVIKPNAAASDAADGIVDATASTSRVRLMVEGFGAVDLDGNRMLAPTFRGGPSLRRWRCGDRGGTGDGHRADVQLGSPDRGSRYRGLVAHAESGIEEWGLRGSAAWRAREDGESFSVKGRDDGQCAETAHGGTHPASTAGREVRSGGAGGLEDVA